MKHLKKYKLFENSSFPTDEKEIHAICKKYKIQNYKIGPGGVVDVDGSVSLKLSGLKKLPLKFGRVTGDFDCSINLLTSLEGSPFEVKGSFECNKNQLTSLEDCPQKIRRISATYNKIYDLGFLPKFLLDKLIKSNFDEENDLFQEVENFRLDLWPNPISKVIEVFLAENPFEDDVTETDIGDGEIRVDPYDVDPEYLEHLNYSLFLRSLKYNYLVGGNKIKESRFLEACDDLKFSAPDNIEGYVWV